VGFDPNPRVSDNTGWLTHRISVINPGSHDRDTRVSTRFFFLSTILKTLAESPRMLFIAELDDAEASLPLPTSLSCASHPFSRSPSSSPPLLYHTPCQLQSLLAGYVDCNEPLLTGSEANSRDSEIRGDFLALQSSGLLVGALLEAGALGDGPVAFHGSSVCLASVQGTQSGFGVLVSTVKPSTILRFSSLCKPLQLICPYRLCQVSQLCVGSVAWKV
jgi:hypothetical protein